MWAGRNQKTKLKGGKKSQKWRWIWNKYKTKKILQKTKGGAVDRD